MPLPGCRNLAPPLLLLLVALTTLLALATPAACSGPRAADSAEDAEDSDGSAEVQRRLRHAGGPRSQDHVLAEDEAPGAAAGSSEEDVALGDEPADDGGDAVKHPRGTSRFLQLYCRTGYNLVIHAGGKVNGTREDRNRYGGCSPYTADICSRPTGSVPLLGSARVWRVLSCLSANFWLILLLRCRLPGGVCGWPTQRLNGALVSPLLFYSLFFVQSEIWGYIIICLYEQSYV